MTPNIEGRSGAGGRGDPPRRPAIPLASAWKLERLQGGAGTRLKNSEPTAPVVSRSVRVLEVSAPALVLGSTQEAPSSVEIETVRRRSGGGAVLLRPDETVWVDVVVPAGDALWSDDVGLAFHWLGETWAAALARVGVVGEVHRSGLVRTSWSSQVCFAGVGAGEVVVPGGASKIVGMASRRTRDWALFQCAVPRRWDPAAYVSLLGLPSSAAADLCDVAAPVSDVAADDLIDAFLAALPT